MGTPWDAAAPQYLEEWVPRILPYHVDLVQEMALEPCARVLVAGAGPGAEVLAVARVLGEKGYVRATDKSRAMVELCREQVARAGLGARVECHEADATAADAPDGQPWDAILCAFSLWQLESPAGAVRAWARALAPAGRIGIITWGPNEPGGPFGVLRASLDDIAPGHHVPDPSVLAEREAMAKMFRDAGLVMVRHTVVRHTLSFPTAAAFVRAMREGCSWNRIGQELGDVLFERVAVRFCEAFGGPNAPLAFDPPATLAIGAWQDGNGS
ncbi:MAG: methyltransferase domain-containing protein [Polyangiaceae bacterium]|nr:methyltransferase domain-containing protein [Polyangiaceae bacterium]